MGGGIYRHNSQQSSQTSSKHQESFDVCKEFLEEQERNVQDLLTGYKKLEKSEYASLRDGVKRKLQEKYTRERHEYESKMGKFF